MNRLCRAASFCMTLCIPAAASVVNPSFEEGFEKWTAGKNMTVDTDTAHHGTASAKIVVHDPLKDAVYLSRAFPVTGGAGYEASCWIKTEDVKPAVCRGASVGAGMFVEWADAKGKYIGPAANACDNFGTKDWFRIGCGPVRAPAEAAQAWVSLCLRGKGTAWFDDFAFVKKSESAVKAFPVDGATINDNTPEFSWKLCMGVTNYVLRLSRNPEFPGGGEIVVDCGGRTRCRPGRKLAEGRWYWKVTALGVDDIRPWTFRQTADEDADCLPPLALGSAARVTHSMQPFVVKIKDDGGGVPSLAYAGGSARMLRRGRGGVFEFEIIPPAGGWKGGITAEDIVTRDAHGNTGRQPFYLLNAPKPEFPVTVGSDGKYRVNGKPFFPLGIYQVTKPFLREVKTAGFDIVHMYRWELSAGNGPCIDYLDACAGEGLRAFVGFDRGTYTGNGLKDGNHMAIVERVGALASHPAVFCWYLYDEPELPRQFVAPDALADYAELVRALDPWHPVVVSTWANAAYRRAWDSHWTQSYGFPRDVFTDFGKHVSSLGNSPITLVLGAVDADLSRRLRHKEPVDPAAFRFDGACFRASADIGIALGANGLMWWWFGKDDDGYYSASRSPRAWRDLTAAVRGAAALKPFLEKEGEFMRGVCGRPGEEVVWWARKISGRTVCYAVNTSAKPVKVELRVPGEDVRTCEFGRYEGRMISGACDRYGNGKGKDK